MRIFGLDFTSAPRPGKAITCAHCRLEGPVLSLEDISRLASFEAFEATLRQPGPWVMGLDFPFGQPRRLVENIGWPRAWEGYVRHVAGMSKAGFVDALAAYRRGRPAGDKQHLRQTDRLAGARSPMMLYGVPVGKMFFEGAPRLLASGASILPCHPTGDPRVILEAYPALVARRWIGKRSYKSDTREKQTPERQAARAEIMRGLRSSELKTHYGFELRFSDEHTSAFLQDGSGDLLDALLCAVQAGWAYMQRDRNYGLPVECDLLEGWIVGTDQ